MGTPSAELGYELLRAVTWASTGGRAPVSTRTLLDRAVGLDAALHDGDVDAAARRNVLRDRIEDLAAIGDLAPLPRGQWLSVPGCIVQLDATDPDSQLLVSGVPLRHLDTRLRSSVAPDGARRILTGRIRAADVGLAVIGFDDWVRRPRRSLKAWTESLLTDSLDPVPEDLEASAFRFYVPDHAHPGARQSERWFETDPSLRGRYLARVDALGGWTQFFVAELSAGIVVGVREQDPHDVRRLMYGLDLAARNPTVARWTETQHEIQLRPTSPLPYAETRVLTALAESRADRGWVLTRHAGTVRRVLTDLGVTLKSDSPPVRSTSSTRRAPSTARGISRRN
ncbi:hypothetical protein RCF27_07105 [Rhodococcus pyridinivorans]|uniref:Uncharacterized protein n=1 Tax=Rhodococcus pyridinivorans TaxID=103816 RepID=A0A7M2XSB2_9NOCA|nr:hypothetical protein [Rhodococcus pyridinivorans]QOW00164.1 hypothetical protein INP59_07390 [Rhodococcus pyridinivorans]WMM74064.1 hypothetical protein RCF27_07105 [Rhodococcus pyridinivorans]